MANETLVEAPPAENVAPNLDSEMSEALSKHFPNHGTPNETTKIEEPRPEIKSEVRVEPKAEAKQESKPDAKKEDKPVEVEKLRLTPEEDGANEPVKNGWAALKNKNKAAHQIIEQKEAEIAKLKAVVAEKGQMSQKELDALKAENGELSKYRAMVDIQADPEFNTTYDTPMMEKIDSMKDLLKGFGINEQTINGIDFLDKNRVGAIAKTLRDNEQHIASEFELEEFMVNAKEVLALSKKRDAALRKHGETYKETLEAKKKESFEKQAEGEGRALKHLETVSQAKDKTGNQMFPFLNKMPVKDSATQPEIDQINGHNKMVDLMQQKVQQAYKMEQPEERMEVAVAAAAAHYLSAVLKSKNARIESLESELKKISTASTETDKTKATLARPRNNGNGTVIPDHTEALAEHFGGKFRI